MQASEQTRTFVKNALGHFAAFFAELAGSEEDAAVAQLKMVSKVDAEAEQTLPPEQFDYYQHRRAYLMRIFRYRLFDSLRGQIEQAVLERAEELVREIELQPSKGAA